MISGKILTINNFDTCRARFALFDKFKFDCHFFVAERRLTRESSQYNIIGGNLGQASSVETSASLDSINLLVDDRLSVPHSSQRIQRSSGSLDSLRNYLSSSPSSASSETTQALAAEISTSLGVYKGNFH